MFQLVRLELFINMHIIIIIRINVKQADLELMIFYTKYEYVLIFDIDLFNALSALLVIMRSVFCSMKFYRESLCVVKTIGIVKRLLYVPWHEE